MSAPSPLQSGLVLTDAPLPPSPVAWPPRALSYTSKLKIYLVAPIICLATLLVVAVVASCWEWFRAKKASREAQNAGQPPVVAVAKNASPSAVPPSPTFAAMSELKGTSQDARRAPPAGALHALASAKKTAGQLKRAGSIRSLWKSSSSTERCIVAGLTLMKLYYLAVSAQVRVRVSSGRS